MPRRKLTRGESVMLVADRFPTKKEESESADSYEEKEAS